MDLLLTNFSAIGNALGWTLIHFIWQGTLLFICYWLLTRLFFKNKFNLHYWSGLAFMLLCLIIPVREFMLQMGLDNTDLIQQLGTYTVGIIQPQGILNPQDMSIALIQKFIPYLVLFWALAVLLISTHLIKSWFSLVKLSQKKSSKLPSFLMKKLDEASTLLRLRFKPVVTISKEIIVPATFGFFKPIILLPTSLLAKLPQDQMEAILLHELCHIKRADFLHNILQLLVETLFFYHPLTKWISRDIRKVREQCCDQDVLKLEANPLTYAKALTNIALIYNKESTQKNSHLQIAANDGELLSRIKFLMVEKRSKSPVNTLILSMLIASSTLFVFQGIMSNKQLNHSTNSVLQLSNDSLTIKQSDTHGYNIPNIYQLIKQQPQEKTTKSSVDKTTTRKERITPVKAKVKKVQAIKTSNSTSASESNDTKPITTEAINTDSSDGSTRSAALDSDTSISSSNSDIKPNKIKNSFPKIIKFVNPVYRKIARQRGVEGTVILSFSINSAGKVRNISIDKSSPLKLMDGSAKRALRQWRFDPKSINSNNLNNRYQQIFSFSLDNQFTCSNNEIGTHLSNRENCSDN